MNYDKKSCGNSRVRTYDHHLNRVPLYLLSYVPKATDPTSPSIGNVFTPVHRSFQLYGPIPFGTHVETH